MSQRYTARDRLPSQANPEGVLQSPQLRLPATNASRLQRFPLASALANAAPTRALPSRRADHLRRYYGIALRLQQTYGVGPIKEHLWKRTHLQVAVQCKAPAMSGVLRRRPLPGYTSHNCAAGSIEDQHVDDPPDPYVRRQVEDPGVAEEDRGGEDGQEDAEEEPLLPARAVERRPYPAEERRHHQAGDQTGREPVGHQRAHVLKWIDEHPGAAGSLSEGLDETLTVIRLGVSETLAKTLRSTNIIESLNDTLGRVSHNVKRWRSGTMAMRWAVTGFIEAKKGFRRLRGYKEMPKFLRALEREIVEVDNCARVA